MESLLEAQEPHALDGISLTLGGITKVVNILEPVNFIIGDMQGGDTLCCSSAGYTNKMNPIFCNCHVWADHCGDPFVECKQMSMLKIQALANANNGWH